MKYWPKAWQLQAEVHTLKKMWHRWRSSYSDKKPGYEPTIQCVRHQEKRVYHGPLQWLSYTTILVCSVWRDAICATAEWSQPPCIYHARYVGRRISHDLNPVTYKIWDIIQQRVYQTTMQTEWFKAASDWCVGWIGTPRYWQVSMSAFENYIHCDTNLS